MVGLTSAGRRVAIVGVIQQVCHRVEEGVCPVASHFLQLVVVLLCHEDTGVLISMWGRVGVTTRVTCEEPVRGGEAAGGIVSEVCEGHVELLPPSCHWMTGGHHLSGPCGC